MLKCSDCESGKKYRAVTIQTPNTATEPDETGHVDLTDDANWKHYGTLNGSFLTKGGREGRVFDQVQAEVTQIFESQWTRWANTIHPKMRVIMDARVFHITAAINVDEANEKIQLHLTEVV